ncbi:MAG: phage terminase large subunit family protein [Acidobacteriota bacterium]|nr:phage terminase large subunit family protein [Acidobacteriota bacterium]
MNPTDELVGSWSEAAQPPPELTVSQWADLRRRLPETSAARGGRWNTDTVPYLRGIMNAVHEPGTRVIALKKCHQSGGSEGISNIIGYHMEHDPCAMLVVQPTAQVAEAWSKERLGDMIRTTPELRKVVREKRPPRGSNESESTLALKIFPGGYLALGGANTENTFARWSVRIALGDDVDRFPAVVGDEGDPADLLINRTTTFHDALAIFVSTPTLVGGRIDVMYGRSDQRRFHITCPGCGRLDWIVWRKPKADSKDAGQHFLVVFDDRDPSTARVECPCGYQITEPERRRLILEASHTPGFGWIPTAEPKETGLVGFHLPAMVSTLGDVTLQRLVEKWLSARARGKENLKVFINTTLAEGWEERGGKIESHTLMKRREHYGPGIEVPLQAPVLTCGVDVQDNRFELQVIGWGPGEERFVVDNRVVPGDPKKAETRDALWEALQRKYHHASGVDLPIQATCIDTGYATEEIYDFVLRYQHRRVFATKGFGGRSGEPIVGKPSEKRYGKSPRPVRLYPINVDDAKSDVMNYLTVEPGQPQLMHWPIELDTIDEEYFAQLCSEHKETRTNKAGVITHSVWVLDRERNEALDTAVLALAAFKLLRPNIEQMAEVLEKAAAAAQQSKPAATHRRAVPVQTQDAGNDRRVSRSTYLGGE